MLGFEEFPLDLDPAPGQFDGSTAAAGADSGGGRRRDRTGTGAASAGVDSETAPAAAGEAGESFKGFHEDITRQSLISVAEQHYKLALAYDEAGMPEPGHQGAAGRGAIAATAIRGRRDAGAALTGCAGAWTRPSTGSNARLKHRRPRSTRAAGCCTSWAIRSTPAGEGARALAVFLELQAESSSYRDVARRVDRLRRAGTGSGG